MQRKQKIENIVRRFIPDKYLIKALIAYFRLRAIFYYGSKYICPFCKNSFRKFLPIGIKIKMLKEKEVIGAGYRINAACPRCDSSDRERLIYLFLTNLFSKQEPKKRIKLLHIAPERNLQKFLSEQKNIDYTSADLDSPLAQVKMDITNINYPKNYFDFIICNHVLEHIEDDKKAMSELYRVLKPKGKAILQVPISLKIKKTIEENIKDPKMRQEKFGQWDHVRLYGEDYKNRLKECDFKVKLNNFAHLLDKKIAERYSINQKEIIYLCKK